MPTTLAWARFENFFRLYEDLKNVPSLIYVIGETHHVYIGSVGCKGGGSVPSFLLMGQLRSAATASE